VSPGSCLIEALDTKQGVIDALCEGRYKNRLNVTDDNLPAWMFQIMRPVRYQLVDEKVL
jgi:hypothetical protein